MILKNKKIVLTGGAGFLGTNVFNQLLENGASKKNIVIPRSKTHDLRDKLVCDKLLKGADILIHMAAKVGGIGFNQKYPGELFYDNAIMGINLIESARKNKVKKSLIVGTICAYPKFTPIPFQEQNLWNGYPEETNAPYGLAKKMLLVQAQAYRSQYKMNIIYLLPVNLYGPEDNFDPKSSHVIPALVKKFVDAKEKGENKVILWGSGKPTREFLYVEDAAKGIVKALLKYNKTEPVNLGSSMEISIKELAKIIKKESGFNGKIVWDKSKPDGQPRRKLDVSLATKEFGFVSSTSFDEGLKKTIKWYTEHR